VRSLDAGLIMLVSVSLTRTASNPNLIVFATGKSSRGTDGCRWRRKPKAVEREQPARIAIPQCCSM
jgi:hypothetical protein